MYRLRCIPLLLTLLVLTSGCISSTEQQTNQTEPPLPPPIPALPAEGNAISADSITGMTPHSTYTNFAQPESFTIPTAYTFFSLSDTDTISLTINDDYIYRYAFISYDGQPWQQVDLTGSLFSTHYITDSATATITIDPGDFGLTSPGQTKTKNYIVTYTCDSSFQCHDGWQIRQFDATLEEETPSWQQGLVSWWTFEDNADDSVGDNHGTVNGATPTSTDCVLGSCYNFDGDGSYIDIGTPSQMDWSLTDATFTVALWIKQRNISGNAVPVGQVLGGSEGWMIYQTGVYNLGFYVYDYATDYVSLGSTLPIGTWTHIVGVSNSTSTCIYKDGAFVACSTKGSGSYASTTEDFLIGKYYPSQTSTFNGSIDEVMVWNRALTGSEVSELHDFYGYEPQAPTCNDGSQNGDETGVDCGGSYCEPCQTVTCGDGNCDADAGENCSSCLADCGCPTGEYCSNGVCLIETSGNTYFVSKDGSDSNPGTFEEPWLTINRAVGNGLSELVAGDTVFVREGVYNERSTLYGYDGTESEPIVLMAYPGEHPIIDGTGIVTGSGSGFFYVYPDYVHIIGLEFQNIDQPVKFMGDYGVLRNCVIHDSWGSAASVLGHYTTIENNHFYNTCMSNENNIWDDGEYWGASMSFNRNPDGNPSYGNTVRHNIMHDSHGEGLDVTITDNSVIEDNIIYDTYSVALYIMNSQNCLIQRNLVYRTKNMGDGYQVGIRPGNEAWVGGNEDENNTIINNIVYGWRRNFYASELINTTVANNIFVNSTYFAGVQISDNIHTNSIFANNIIIQENSLQPIYFVENEDVTFSNNLYNKAYDADAVGPGDIVADPGFAKVGGTGAGELSGEYFKLLSDSPAIDSGTPLASVSDDYFGNPRNDSKPDIGAHEH